MPALTNRQQREEDDSLVELLRRLDSHSERRDLIRQIDICQTPDKKHYLVLSKDGLQILRPKDIHIPSPTDTTGWTAEQWNQHYEAGVTRERVRDFRACVALFRGMLYVQQVQGLLAQMDA